MKHASIHAAAHHGTPRPEPVRIDALSARIAKWQRMGMAPEQVAAPEIARQRYEAKCDKLASDLDALTVWARLAAEQARTDNYYGTAYERAVLSAAYDVTECDALYDRINEIEPMQEVL